MDIKKIAYVIILDGKDTKYEELLNLLNSIKQCKNPIYIVFKNDQESYSELIHEYSSYFTKSLEIKDKKIKKSVK